MNNIKISIEVDVDVEDLDQNRGQHVSQLLRGLVTSLEHVDDEDFLEVLTDSFPLRDSQGIVVGQVTIN
jgi:hypothetical protein